MQQNISVTTPLEARAMGGTVRDMLKQFFRPATTRLADSTALLFEFASRLDRYTQKTAHAA